MSKRRSRMDPPETVIERAKEFLKNGKTDDAMNELYGLIQYRRRAQWVESYENAMKEYVRIGVENLKSCREGLLSYRSMVQQARPDSLEKVLKLFVDSCEDKGNKERELFAKEEGEAKEDSVLSEIRLRQFESVTLKYQWDCYSTVLTVLKNNGKLNHVFGETVTRASKFCCELGRSNELKSLCDVIRRRLPYIENNQEPEYALKLNSVTLNAMVANRLQLLDTALEMNLYQESYKSMTDTLQVIRRAEGLKKSIDYDRLSEFYQQVSRVFWSCRLYLLHAYAVYHSYRFRERHVQSLGKKQKNKSQELVRLRRLLARAVVAALVVTSEGNGLAGDDQSMYTLAEQYSLTAQPSRAALIATLRKESQMFEQSSTAAMDLCQLLENPFNPLSFTVQFKGIVSDLEKEGVDVAFYRNGLRKIGVIRLLSQLSRVYKSIEWKRFRKLSFEDMDDESLERIITEAMHNGRVSVRLSHSGDTITFADDSMESPTIQKHLYCLAQRLGAISLDEVDSKRKEEDQQRRNVFAAIKDNVQKEHKQVTARLQMIHGQRKQLEMWKKTESHWAETRKREERQRQTLAQRQVYAEEKKQREEDEKKKRVIEEKKEQVQSWAKKIDLRTRTAVAPSPSAGFAAAVAAGGTNPKLPSAAATTTVGSTLDDFRRSKMIRPPPPTAADTKLAEKEKEFQAAIRRAQQGDTSLTVEALEEKHEEIQADRRRRERDARKDEKRLFDFQIRSQRKYLVSRIMKAINSEKGERTEEKKLLYRKEVKDGRAKHSEQLTKRDRVLQIKQFVPLWESQLNEAVQQRVEEQTTLKAKKELERKQLEEQKKAALKQQQSQPVKLKAGVGGGTPSVVSVKVKAKAKAADPPIASKVNPKPKPKLKAGVAIGSSSAAPATAATSAAAAEPPSRPGKYKPSRRQMKYDPSSGEDGKNRLPTAGAAAAAAPPTRASGKFTSRFFNSSKKEPSSNKQSSESQSASLRPAKR